ncbi:site-specific tyrosine recombinase/integron integrase [Chloroflexota bacterium]
MTLATFITEFLEYLEIEKGCSELTIQQYRHYLTRFCGWISESYSITDPGQIDLEHVRKYRIYLSRLKTHEDEQLKKITQSYHIITLRSFFRYLIAQRDINTLSPDKIELPRAISRSITFLNLDQLDRLLDSVDISKEPGLRDRSIMEMFFSTGLRVSELVKLNRDDVNLDRKEFGVRGKGAKLRVVFLSNTAADWIKRYLEVRNDRFKPLFIRYGGEKDMEKDGDNRRLSVRSVQKLISKYAKKSGLPIKVSPHTLRHSFATDLLIAGADIRSVQELLGHESIRTTQVYTHVTDKHLKEVHKTFHRR